MKTKRKMKREKKNRIEKKRKDKRRNHSSYEKHLVSYSYVRKVRTHD